LTELLEEMRTPKSILESLKKDGPIGTIVFETENKSGWKKRKLASADSSGLSMEHCAAG
jgi:hypothetical protein